MLRHTLIVPGNPASITLYRTLRTRGTLAAGHRPILAFFRRFEQKGHINSKPLGGVLSSDDALIRKSTPAVRRGKKRFVG